MSDLLNLPGGDPSNQTPPPAGDGNPPKEDPKGNPPAGSGEGDPQDPPKDNFAQDWKNYIPEEYKDRAEWNNIKDPSDIFKNYINAQQMISKSVRIPDDTASPEDIANFYSKLGKPQSKDDYDFTYTPAKENYIYNKDSFDFGVFKDIADKANLTKDQYQALASAYIDINNENYLNYNKQLEDKAAEELKTSEAALKAAWGQNYNSNINTISERIGKLYSKDTIARMQNAGLFRDAKFLETHLKLTKMMMGDTVFIEGNAVENVPQTLTSLQEKRDRLMSEDYEKNKEQVLALNKQIVQLKQSQKSGAAKYTGNLS